MTGYVFQPDKIKGQTESQVDYVPATFELTDCLRKCYENEKCQSVNFETGLCILFKSSAMNKPQALNTSFSPVYTLYAQKICLNIKPAPSKKLEKCLNSWSFETVPGYALRQFPGRKLKVKGKLECMEKCISEEEFQCRSLNYNRETRECTISEMDRHTIATIPNSDKYFVESKNEDYMESNCVDEPRTMCEFRPIKGRVLKTTNSVHQDIKTLKACQEACLDSDYRCFSFDLGDPASKACRISHLDTGSLSHIEDAYYERPGSVTYELYSCYDVNVQCKAREMISKIRMSRVFLGKIYGRKLPITCANDVKMALDFDLPMAYNDNKCDITQKNGNFTTEVIVQHHDTIVTTKDIGLTLKCSYDLSNTTINNTLSFDGATSKNESIPNFFHETVVASPTVGISINDRNGRDIRQAKVGDMLTLRFAIGDENSPFSLFIRSLVATDGTGSNEIVLIGDDGCPTDSSILGPVKKINGDEKALETTFAAFKFPSSDEVQFRAVVSPCLSKCSPVHCFTENYDGSSSAEFSYGRRRRRRSTQNKDSDMVVVQSIKIKDTFEFDKKNDKLIQDFNEVSEETDRCPVESKCLSLNGIFICCGLLLIAQIGVVFLWYCMRQIQRTRTDLSDLDQNSIHASIQNLYGSRVPSQIYLVPTDTNQSKHFK